MIRCPECGQEAPDDAKFCDRCGQGLSKAASSVAHSSPTRPMPLAAGASLKNGIEIVVLTSQTSIENRYSAKRVRDGKTESIALRERLGPHAAEAAALAESQNNSANDGGAHEDESPAFGEDLGEVFGRVLALSQIISHPAFQRATEGFAENRRVYLVYADEELKPLRRGSQKMSEPEAITAAVQICQAISFVHRRALRLNDICPESVALARDGRIKLTGLDYVSNDNELQSEPIFNDGYTAPEIYRGKRVDKRADIFSAGAMLYTWLTGARIPSESWREEAGPVQLFPPHLLP